MYNRYSVYYDVYYIYSVFIKKYFLNPTIDIFFLKVIKVKHPGTIPKNKDVYLYFFNKLALEPSFAWNLSFPFKS